MPELPDIVVYLEALKARIHDRSLEHVLLQSPFLLRTATPPIKEAEGRKVITLRCLGKRICLGLEDDLWLVLHLMIAGRLHWKGWPEEGAAGEAATGSGQKSATKGGKGKAGLAKGITKGLSKAPKKNSLAAFDFSSGRLTLTEAGTQRRASLHVVEGEAGLAALDPGGLELLDAADLDQLGDAPSQLLARFAEVLQASNHTLKRALTDPRSFSGIGNAYSDEILFAAQLSPITLTQRLKADEVERLFLATRSTLVNWVHRLRADAAGQFPEKVTAFREEMAVHGRYRLPCPRCGGKVQRIRYAANETNYCPHCQTGGKLLADRALSRLLRNDWPRTPEELG